MVNIFLSGGPGDLDFGHHAVLAEAKMQPEIVLRKVTYAATYFVELHPVSTGDGHPSAYRGLIALGADQLEQDRVSGGFRAVDQQCRWFTDIEQEDVNLAVIVSIAERRAST